MSAQHTPGPWAVYDDSGTAEPSPIVTAWDGEQSIDVAIIPHGPQAQNDARLIAAAPELLEALKLAVRQNSHDMLMTGEELRKCEAAIDKATRSET
jgi:hypothetical protein